jgi:thymidine kinase
MNNKYVIYGCMFAGKTSKMLSLIKWCRLPYTVISHSLHNRFETHDGKKINFISCQTADAIIAEAAGTKIWFIDEIQFFSPECVRKLLDRPESIYFSGLDTNFLGGPFESMQILISTVPPGNITKLCSICKCGNSAIYSKLLVKPPNTGIILIGGKSKYEPACANCFAN